jgi:hypothetical protein
MNKRSFKAIASAMTLISFLGTPLLVFAEDIPGTGTIDYTLGTAPDTRITTRAPATQVQDPFSIQNGVATPLGGGCANGNCAGGIGATGGALGGLLGGAGGNGLLSGLAIGSLLGGGLGGGFGGGGGASGAVGQALTLAGALTGNMGLLLAGMITSMIGGIGGGAGATPQRGFVDEGYVAPGQAGPYGAGHGSGYYGGYGANPYYATPTPAPTTSPSGSCEKSIFIAKDTTVTPNVVKPYPNDKTIEIPQNQCILTINSDSVSHTVQAKAQGSDAVIATQAIDKEKSHIFRFAEKKTYTLCVDAVATACTTVAVK